MSPVGDLEGGVWTVDPGYSSITFKIRHLGMRDYRAGFRDVHGTLDAEAGTLELSVQLDNLDLSQPDIRERLLSAEFLDAAGYPRVQFVSSGLVADEGSRDVTVPGNLTIHGVTRPVQGAGRIGIPGPHLLTGKEQITFELAATIDRREFGIAWQEELPEGGLTLSNEVTLEAVLELALDS